MSRDNARKAITFAVNDLRFFRIHRLAVALAASDRGYKVEVIGARTDDFERESEPLRDFGFTVHGVPMSRSGARPWQELQTILAIRRVLARCPPRLMHNVGFKAVVNGTHAAWLSPSTPAVVNHVTGLGHMYAGEGLRKRLSRAIMNLGFASSFRVVGRQRIIVQNPDDARLLSDEAGAPDKRLRIILGSGVDTDRFRKMEDAKSVGSEPVVLFAARLLWSKGVGDFVEMARSLRVEFDQVRWVIVGAPDEGNLSSVPPETVDAWASEPGIEWWGWRDDMDRVYQQADVVCLPTVYREGVPKVLIEAASSEVPVVATDMPGCREIVRHGENGFLVPPRDGPALTDAVRRLLENAAVRRRMGRRGRELVKDEFSQERVVEATMRIYGELLS